MYIGPWQEYNLSKSKGKVLKLNDSLKADIENAIISKLDPVSAQTAILALNPYFEKNAIQTPPLPSSSRSSNAFLRHDSRRRPPRIIPVVDMFDRGPHRQQPHTSSPFSMRSSVSEPSATPNAGAHSPMVASAMSTPTKHVNHSSSPSQIIPHPASNSSYDEYRLHQQPPYNTAVALSYLRLDREKREEARRKSVAKVMGWGSSGKTNVAVSNEKYTKPVNQTEQKKELVMSMKNRYIAQDNGKSIILPTLTKGSGVTTIDTVGGHHHRPTVPCFDDTLDRVMSPIKQSSSDIQDIDLTDVEMSKISKYFSASDSQALKLPSITQTNAKASPSRSGFKVSTPLGAANNNCGGFSSRPSSINNKGQFNSTLTRRGLHSPFPVLDGEGNFRPGTGLSDSGGELSIASNFDELYMGGVDGLLKWSAQLDLNNL